MAELLFRFDWIIYIAVGSCVLVWVRRHLGLKPSIALGPLLVTNSHWLVSGIGAFIYPDRDSFDRFDLRLGALPYALMTTAVFIWSITLHWLFRRGGADLLAGTPEVVRSLNLPSSADRIKLFALAAVCGGVLGVASLVFIATNTPR